MNTPNPNVGDGHRRNPPAYPVQFEQEVRHHPNPPAVRPKGGGGAEPPIDPRRGPTFGELGEVKHQWHPPAPLPEMPPVPPFPLDEFPAKVADYWRAAAAAIGVPVEYVAVPGLAALGTAAGRSRAVELKRGYTESLALWTVTIGAPGSAKSSSLKAATAPLNAAEAGWRVEHQKKMKLYDTAAEQHAEKLKGWRRNKCEGEPPEEPARPVLRQVLLDNTTTEAAARVMNDNPRGSMVVKDELSGFVRSMNQYRGGGKGDDKQFWLSAWAGAASKTNRAGNHDAGPLVVEHPFVAVAGMMTPSSLPELRGDNRNGEAEQDGFVDRFLFSFPDPLPANGETWAEIAPHLAQGYIEVFAHLLGVQLVAEELNGVTYRSPYLIRPDEGARAVWESFTAEIARRKNVLDLFDPYRGVLGKLQGYALRIAGVLWAVGKACGDLGPNAPLDADTLSRACKLIDYFDAHGRRCLGVGWADRTARVAKRMVNWLAGEPTRKAFSRTEAFQQMKDRRDVTTSKRLDPVFRLLTDHCYIRPADPGEHQRPGPAPEVYVVNPLWVRTAD